MQDISLHVLDIAENSIRAGATRIEITVDAQTGKNLLTVRIKDNGKGMSGKEIKKAIDPFYTTKKGKKTGLGLSLLAQSAQEAGGSLAVRSQRGKGTDVRARFVLDHIDRRPLGSMTDTIMALIGGHGDRIDIVYIQHLNKSGFRLSTLDVKAELDGVSIRNPAILGCLRKNIAAALGKTNMKQKGERQI